MKVEVYLWGTLVGTLSWDYSVGKSVFAYSRDFLDSPYDISPVFYSKQNKRVAPFYGNPATEGLPEFLADSLPDDWGNALFGLWAQRHHVRLDESNSLAKLSFIGERAMGALEFRPAYEDEMGHDEIIALNDLYNQAVKVLQDRSAAILTVAEEKTLSRLIQLGTSVGGRHAKGLIAIDSKGNVRSGQIALPRDYKYYILKFKEDVDIPTSEIEKIYCDMASDCGIRMMPSSLYRVEGVEHFLTQRFDRTDTGEKLHVQTLKALVPSAKDYANIFWLIESLRIKESRKEQLFRQMVFNYFAGVSDDHSKNFSFIMDKNGEWDLSPAYDLTFTSNTWLDPSAYVHSLCVWGKNSHVSKDDFIDFGEDFGIESSQKIVKEVADVVSTFPSRSQKYGIEKEWTDKIWKVLQTFLPQPKPSQASVVGLTGIVETLRAHFGEKFVFIDEVRLSANGNAGGTIVHFNLDQKKRTCVTDEKTGDVCVSPGHIQPGELHMGSWKTLSGKPAVVHLGRVISLESKMKAEK